MGAKINLIHTLQLFSPSPHKLASNSSTVNIEKVWMPVGYFPLLKTWKNIVEFLTTLFWYIRDLIRRGTIQDSFIPG